MIDLNLLGFKGVGDNSQLPCLMNISIKSEPSVPLRFKISVQYPHLVLCLSCTHDMVSHICYGSVGED